MIGSTWNKWDLHAHSPLTHQNNQFNGATIENYVDSLITKQISLVGVTNYFYFAENELEIVRSEIAKKAVSITVLGNVEFRITQPNKDGEWINVHCIFAEHVKTSQINEALSRFEVVNTGGFQQAIYCCNSSFTQNGIQPSDVIVDFDKLIEHMKKSFRFGVDYLIAVCPNGYGGFRPNAKEGRSIAAAIEIEKKGQLLLGNKDDREFFLHYLERYEGAVPKPVFCCSDAHGFTSDPQNGRFSVGENYTWVKAKPTFEGLRQALIEPEVRVQQTDDFIEQTFIKPRFTSIQLGGDIFTGQAIQFQPQTIPLNPNMVAIIGGRGTGKSLFLDSMHSMFNHSAEHNSARSVNVDSLKITFDQGDGTELVFDSLDDTYAYLHVSQGDIQNFSQEPSRLSDEIKLMLGIHGASFDSVTVNAIANNIDKYRGFVQYWGLLDNAGNRLNTPEYQRAIVDKFTKLMATITNPQNKLHIEQYQNNLKLVNEKQAIINELKEVQAVILRSAQEINSSLGGINQKLLAPNKIPLITTTATDQKVTDNILQFESEIGQLQTNNLAIVSAFQQQGINQDISSLLDKISEYQLAIDTANTKLQEIEQKTQHYIEYVQTRASLALTYRDYLNEEKSKIDEKFESLKIDKTHWNDDQNALVASMLADISINGNIIFDSKSFYEGLERCLNRGKFKATQNRTTAKRLEEMFAITDFTGIEDFFNLINGNKQISCEGDVDAQGQQIKITIEDLFWRAEYFNQGGRFELLNYLFSPDSVKNYLYVNAEFEYKGKTVDKLSVGQRGTFYVCLKLATDPFGSPFVFDQPEDDLDNDFIMKQLVPLFRQIKKYRQVIIVTHNANLVVNTDAEQIIVASNEGEIISYDAGALEDGSVVHGVGIKASICNILEGGSYAFEKRERKYGIQALV
jgi:ABC-type cobalamin/Fe3+-siderophores transport system ATPase subunit